METLIQDVRYGLRMLAKNPGFTGVAVLTLALGIGANTAVFTLINAVMLQMLPVQDPEQLVRAVRIVQHGNQTVTGSSFTYPAYLQFRDRNQVFSGLLAAPRAGAIVAEMGAGGEQARCLLVSGNYFAVLGVTAIRGRTFGEEADKRGATPVAVLSYSFWQRHFARDPGVTGKSISLNNSAFSVIGIAPRNFQGADPGVEPDVWVPMATQPQLMPNSPLTLSDEGWRWLGMIGRLKPNVTARQAQANMQLIFDEMLAARNGQRQRDPERREIRTERVELAAAASGFDTLRQQFARPLFVLMGIVALILLITCANVANLLLARASRRRKEMAVRLAVGADRRRLMQQLLTESLLLALLGSGLGILIAYWASAALIRLMSRPDAPIALNLVPDGGVLGFTLTLAITTAILFGLAPALLASRVDPNSGLKEGAGSTAGGRPRLGRILVSAEIALSLLLVVAAGLFTHTFANLKNLDPGFRREGVLLFSLNPPRKVYAGERRAQLYAQLLARLRAQPGVAYASFSAMAPITGGGWDGVVRVEGYTPQPNEEIHLNLNAVESDYFKAMETPLLLGRDFQSTDAQTSPTAAVINEAMARAYFPGSSPLGRHFGWGPGSANREFQIVGVVKNAKYLNLREEFHATAYIYASALVGDEGFSGRTFEIRTTTSPLDLVSAVREELRALDPELKLLKVKTLEEQVDSSLHQEQLVATLSSFFGALALLLAAVGLYGLMAYAVARRTSEIGIRIALGARGSDVMWMILKETFWMVGAGIAIGLPAALASGRLVRSMLYGLSTVDPITIVSAIFVMGTTGLLASFLPARRAAKVDPMVALRYE